MLETTVKNRSELEVALEIAYNNDHVATKINFAGLHETTEVRYAPPDVNRKHMFFVKVIVGELVEDAPPPIVASQFYGRQPAWPCAKLANFIINQITAFLNADAME